MRKCICGETIPYLEQYGPASQVVLKWYENGQGFGNPGSRKKFYLCSRHTNEVVDLLEAYAENIPVVTMRETQDDFTS